jgi:hypothetical protein
MEVTQAKPTKKRRRWLIVAFVLVLASVSWWNWPRGDARFVGTWEFWVPNSTTPSWIVELRSNGTGVVALHPAPESQFSLGVWRPTNFGWATNRRPSVTL